MKFLDILQIELDSTKINEDRGMQIDEINKFCNSSIYSVSDVLTRVFNESKKVNLNNKFAETYYQDLINEIERSQFETESIETLIEDEFHSINEIIRITHEKNIKNRNTSYTVDEINYTLALIEHTINSLNEEYSKRIEGLEYCISKTYYGEEITNISLVLIKK